MSEALRKAGRVLRLLEDKSSNTQLASESHELSHLPSSSTSIAHPRSSPSKDLEKPKPIRIRIGLSSAPLLGVLLLLITTSIGGDQIAKGIAGDAGVRPYDVLVLFM